MCPNFYQIYEVEAFRSLILQEICTHFLIAPYPTRPSSGPRARLATGPVQLPLVEPAPPGPRVAILRSLDLKET